MAVTSQRQVTVINANIVPASMVFSAGVNANAPGDMDVLTLPTGDTVVAFPTGGTVVQGATIIPPAGNTNTITVKGTTADVGVAIHRTDPTSIGFDTNVTTQTSIVFTVSATVTGLRIVWT